ncbi:MAG: type I-B CRISPR-associated protein Cas5b [bacterium]
MTQSLLVFDLIGKLAHFKKFYTNSSSLTYDFPPPTVVRGVIGAILGIEKDNYYDFLSPERTMISVSVQQPVRKIMQTINYVRTNKNDFSSPKSILVRFLRGSRVPYQVPLEVVLSSEEGNSLTYRIYFKHADEAVMRSLKHQLASDYSIYPLYLGISEFIAGFHYRGEKKYDMKKGMAEKVSSVVNVEKLGHQGIDFLASEGCHFVKDRMPIAFKQGRELWKVSNLIYERSGKPFKADLKEYAAVSSDDGQTTDIVFI